jgi:hypothetical protein
MMMKNWQDDLLVIVLSIFAFTALVFEPLFYFGCNWNYDWCMYEKFYLVSLTKKIWSIYIQWDPLFLRPPHWLKVLSCIEVFIFGPLYALSAYGLNKRKWWLPFLVLPFTGALFYSTIVYFAMEFVYTEPGTNLNYVLLINIPWSIFPLWLAYRVINITSQSSMKKTF